MVTTTQARSRLTLLESRVLDAVTAAAAPASVRDIADAIEGEPHDVRGALYALEGRGLVTCEYAYRNGYRFTAYRATPRYTPQGVPCFHRFEPVALCGVHIEGDRIGIVYRCLHCGLQGHAAVSAACEVGL
jgi:hypothetical protein